MLIKAVPSTIDLEFEVGKTYKTKFQTGERFTITNIITRPFLNTTKIVRFDGIYENHPHIGVCPLDPERLIPDKQMVMVESQQLEYTRKQVYEVLSSLQPISLEAFNELMSKLK